MYEMFSDSHVTHSDGSAIEEAEGNPDPLERPVLRKQEDPARCCWDHCCQSALKAKPG